LQYPIKKAAGFAIDLTALTATFFSEIKGFKGRFDQPEQSVADPSHSANRLF